VSRHREILGFLAGLGFSGGACLLVLGATGVRPALVGGIAVLALLALLGLVIGTQAWRHRERAVPRRYHEKPAVADSVPVGYDGGDNPGAVVDSW
jgi:hypothetical protein